MPGIEQWVVEYFARIMSKSDKRMVFERGHFEIEATGTLSVMKAAVDGIYEGKKSREKAYGFPFEYLEIIDMSLVPKNIRI